MERGRSRQRGQHGPRVPGVGRRRGGVPGGLPLPLRPKIRFRRVDQNALGGEIDETEDCRTKTMGFKMEIWRQKRPPRSYYLKSDKSNKAFL